MSADDPNGPESTPHEPFEAERFDVPFESPVQPHELGLDSEIQFDCHPGVPCFNACCRNIDITLTPYDIVRLKRRLEMSSREFVGRYTLPFEMDFHGMPGLKMMTKPGSAECVFLSEEGCTVYGDRPAACRYYALGSMGVRRKGDADVVDIYFLVKEPHCKGYQEPRTLTVRQYREDQGVDTYDEMNREWRDIVIKKRTSGPTLGRPSERSLQLFDMCSYDVDSFREFIRSPGFRDLFDLPDEEHAALVNDEDRLLQFAFRFLKQVLFGEWSIPMRDGARERRLETRRPVLDARRQQAEEEHRQHRSDALDDTDD